MSPISLLSRPNHCEASCSSRRVAVFCWSTHHYSSPVALGWFFRWKDPNATCSRCLPGQPHLQTAPPSSFLLEEQRSLGLSQSLEHLLRREKPTYFGNLLDCPLHPTPNPHGYGQTAAVLPTSATPTCPSSRGLEMRFFFLKDLLFFSPSLEHFKKYTQTKTIL